MYWYASYPHKYLQIVPESTMTNPTIIFPSRFWFHLHYPINYNTFVLNHCAHLLHSLLMITLHPAFTFQSIVRVVKSRRIIFLISVECWKNSILSQDRLVALYCKSFGRSEIYRYLCVSSLIFYPKCVALGVRRWLFLFFGHWRALQL